jgi:hypothetical protein
MRELIPSETILARVQNGRDSFAYEACDIPAGMTIAEYRKRRVASSDRSARGRMGIRWPGLMLPLPRVTVRRPAPAGV